MTLAMRDRVKRAPKILSDSPFKSKIIYLKPAISCLLTFIPVISYSMVEVKLFKK
jgi:hypothetical protein